ncbi:MBL fold metallo-hydrolase [Clostridium sp. MSJ-4]|uniref:MBL fold metallo-hydrolase n=1 Tax=Clostridium simiarum TaxID=2841506 RepID=A0ABS6EZR6_9CLOT|nr:MBL fold metallo-hydrolase [Clostridium simiarum]MBU5591129.1 MBL fold metallo-hydrolase [Clostridium simiarum]
MYIEFYGAAGCVTGSCHIMVANEKKILLDCGLFQGRDEKEMGNEEFPFDPKTIDYVILSHSHIDHSGRLPLLYKKGFKGDIIATKATADLCRSMLIDSGHIQEMETEWKNRKRMRLGLQKIEPLYTAKLGELTSYLLKGIDYDEKLELFEGFQIRFKDAGHLLGSAITEIFIKEKEKEEVKIVYSGDIGNIRIPILRDPSIIEEADYIIMESTYGNRNHEIIEQEFEGLAEIIEETFKKGGNVVIPSFAVGRTQEVIYILNKFVENKRLKDIKVYVDSPLAAESTRIFEKHIDYYDDEAKSLVLKGDNPLSFDGLYFTSSVEESVKVNKIQKGAVIISASGMCEAGRIKHHLKHNLWRKESSIVFVGYQAEGTLGRSILDGSKKVSIFGEDIAVNAKIYNLPGLSGHADKKGLLNWVKGYKKGPKEILLVHGDKDAQKAFKKLLEENGFKARNMGIGEKYYINEADESAKDTKARLIKYISSIRDMDNISRDEILEKVKNILYDDEII